LPNFAAMTARLWQYAMLFAVLTIVFNIAEGLVSLWFGFSDDMLTLSGFGVDSFIETISAVGVAVMITRIRNNPFADRSRFEITALKLTGWCFYLLGLILTIGAIFNVVYGHKPGSTLPGVIISLISIISMLCLIFAKRRLGVALSCQPLIADANCNLVCVYMSLVLLVASGAFTLFHLGWIDTVGTAGIIFFSVKEGKESMERAQSLKEV
jgi:divalent metal cation (Fe/Co/Zn/Cd) transporter